MLEVAHDPVMQMMIFLSAVGLASIVIQIVGKFRKARPDRETAFAGGPGHVPAEKALHDRLANLGIRMYMLSYGSGPINQLIYMHPHKTTPEWRSDIRRIVGEIKKAGLCGDEAINALLSKLQDAGYMETTDVVSDVYECRVDGKLPGIFDNPIHLEQADGFGHHGWESKK
ncbi:hypothetical protein F6V30_14485 [Oryzomonas sagensis]|uniref:Uncharacterized protein n=1 Tax=Oryzomonas sagensis TaxID=2603857 RepID=A0ABQ6TL86_9BACT|nr:hypothetical protein [Oryzomonas sagensis]KAB0669040.1 hypothetical protein F6V30_14485 [Oryzomonas sagensis]